MSAIEKKEPSGSYCQEMTSKDKVIFFNSKDLNGPVSSELLKSLDVYEDEPGKIWKHALICFLNQHNFDIL
jgi:hypothetical protein